jgi:uncharacterized integral membrane protein
MKYVYSVLVLLLALFLAAFIQQNGTAIQLNYFYWATPLLPLSLYMILSFAVGYALAVLVGFTSGIRFRLRASGAEKEVRQVRSELQELKKAGTESVDPELQTDSGASREAASAVGEGDVTGDDPTQSLTGDNNKPDGDTDITGSGDVEGK